MMQRGKGYKQQSQCEYKVKEISAEDIHNQHGKGKEQAARSVFAIEEQNGEPLQTWFISRIRLV